MANGRWQMADGKWHTRCFQKSRSLRCATTRDFVDHAGRSAGWRGIGRRSHTADGYGEKFAGDFVGGRVAVFGGFAATGFAQAENSAAVNDEILFASAGVRVRTADEGASDVHEVAIGP